MAAEREQAIRERAYALWVEGGRQHGTTDQDWLRAEQDLAPVAPSGPEAGAAGAEPKRQRAPGRGKAPTASEFEAAVGGLSKPAGKARSPRTKMAVGDAATRSERPRATS